MSIYNTDTGKIENLYYSNNDVTSTWLDIPYDKDKLEKLRQEMQG